MYISYKHSMMYTECYLNTDYTTIKLSQKETKKKLHLFFKTLNIGLQNA